jgi:hypothetical protein
LKQINFIFGTTIRLKAAAIIWNQTLNSMKIIFYIIILVSLVSCKTDSLLLVENYNQTSKYSPLGYTSGYVSHRADTIIPLDKYERCFTKKFKHYAIVLDSNRGLIGIDRNENKLFNAVWNGEGSPIEESDGMILIIEDGKYGFANFKGEIVIQPIYSCANSFYNGKAKVSFDCKESKDEHLKWDMNEYFYIDKKGIKIK